MNILAINTSSTSGSIAICKDNKISFISYLDINITHSERLMPQIEFGLKQSRLEIKELDLICLANGPGSFTGIRIGLAAAKGICMAHQIPLLAINNLKLLAYNVYGSQLPILSLVDAKMNEIYGALYSPDMKEIIPPQNAKPDEFLKKIKEPVMIVGCGAERYKHIIEESGIDYKPALPHQNIALASTLITIALEQTELPKYDFSTVADLEPYYLRKSQAELVRDQKLAENK